MWIADVAVDDARPELPVTALDPNQPLPDALRDGFLDVCRQVDQHDAHALEAAVWVMLAASKTKTFTAEKCLRWLYAVCRGFAVRVHQPDTPCVSNYRLPRLCGEEVRHMHAVARELRLCLQEVVRLAGHAFLALSDLTSISAHRHVANVANVTCKMVRAVEHSASCACADRLADRPELAGLTFVVFRLAPLAVARQNRCWMMGALPLRVRGKADPVAAAVAGLAQSVRKVRAAEEVDAKLDAECAAVMYPTRPHYHRAFTAVRLHQTLSSAAVLGTADTVTAALLADVLAHHWEAVAPNAYMYHSQFHETQTCAADLLTTLRAAQGVPYWAALHERRVRDVSEHYDGVLQGIVQAVGAYEHRMAVCVDRLHALAAGEGCVVKPPCYLMLSDMVAVTLWAYAHRWPSTAPARWFERERRIFHSKHVLGQLQAKPVTYIEDVPVEQWPTELPAFVGKVLCLNNLAHFCPPLLDILQVNTPAVGDLFRVQCLFYSRTQRQSVVVEMTLKPLRLLNLAMLQDFFVHRTHFGRLPNKGFYEPSHFGEQDAPTEEELWM